jgi:hypothetical protein
MNRMLGTDSEKPDGGTSWLPAGSYDIANLDGLGIRNGSFPATAIPEPTTVNLFTISGICVWLVRRMRTH